jgi:hypothetical protein
LDDCFKASRVIEHPTDGWRILDQEAGVPLRRREPMICYVEAYQHNWLAIPQSLE